MLNMIYFDNAATGFKKPDEVINATINTIKYLSVNAGRSSHALAAFAEEQIYQTRKKVANFFNAEKIERVIFTKNCTEALNVAINGTLKRGGNVITSVFEHNSVLRPLYSLEARGLITLTIIKPSRGKIILKEDIERAITDKTYLVCLTAVSNVTGEINDYESIGAFLKQKNILFLVDGAQGAGHVNFDLKKQNIDLFCFAGHKGLDAIQGVGCLIFNQNTQVKPLLFGGSGSETFAKRPSGYPELLECGTANLPAILSLKEAVGYTQLNLEKKQKYLIQLTAKLIDELKKIKGVTLYSEQSPSGIVSFGYKEFFSQEIAGILSQKYDIAVRGGFHCAPLCHKFLNTADNGLIRVSFSQYNTVEEISRFVCAIQSIDEYLF